MPVLEPDAEPLRILHLSDLHMMPDQRRKQTWVAALAGTDPDLVVVTGDNMADPGAVPGVLRALDPFLSLPGAFVFGSNDYRGPVWRNPLRYLLPASASTCRASTCRPRTCGRRSWTPAGPT